MSYKARLKAPAHFAQFLLILPRTFCKVTRKIFLTFSLVLRILALRMLDSRSFSYFSYPLLHNALGIHSCTLELGLIPLNISLPSFYDRFHYAGCSVPPRSLLSTFQYIFLLRLQISLKHFYTDGRNHHMLLF